MLCRHIDSAPPGFICSNATLAVVFPFSIPSGDEIRIYRLQILFAGVLSFDPLGADHFCLAGIPVFPCNPVLRSPFEAMGKIPERLLYLRSIGSSTDYQFRTILRQTGSAGCCTKHHPGRFPGFRDLRGVGIGQLSGQLLRASVFDDLLIPGVAPLVVGGFPLRLSSGAVFLPALLFCSSGRYWLIRRRCRCVVRNKRQILLYCLGSTLCGLSRGFGGRFRGRRSSRRGFLL